MYSNIPYDIKHIFKLTACDKHTIDVKQIQVNEESFNVLIIDGLYENIDMLRNIVTYSPSGIFNIIDSDTIINNRNGIDYYDCRCVLSTKNAKNIDYIRYLVSQYYDIAIESDVKGTLYSNWYYMLKNRTSDYALPHVDCFDGYKNPIRQFTILTFLNKQEDCYGGTGFYKNRYLNSVYPVNKHNFDYKDLTNVCPHIELLNNYYIMPVHYMEEWEMVDYIPMKPNRTIIFPSNIYHGAYFPTNHYKTIPRINIVTWEVEKIN
jgi:hypothetical protein